MVGDDEGAGRENAIVPGRQRVYMSSVGPATRMQRTWTMIWTEDASISCM